MPGRYGDLDYPTLTKRSFFLGVGLFVVGAAGEAGVHAAGLSVPWWTTTLLFDAEVIGILVGLLAPIVFGVLLPLTE